MNIFGDTLRELRKQAGVTIAQMATRLDVNEQYISDVERGKRGPLSLVQIEFVADIFGLEYEVLVRSAAQAKGYCELPVHEFSSPLRLHLVGVLSRSWKSLNDHQLEEILQLLR